MALLTRLGLRARVTLVFGLGALLVSLSVGMATYLTTRHFLVDARETTSQHIASRNAKTVLQDLSTPTKTLTRTRVLTAADAGTSGSVSILEQRGTWYDRVLSMGPSSIPASVRHDVARGTAASQTFLLTGSPYIAIGFPMPSVDAQYYQLFNISDLTRTLRILALVLFGAGLITTALGTVVGRWASGRSLRPLRGVSRAAVAIAEGRLGTRLPPTEDRDLAGLTGSFNRMVDQLQERIEREERFTSDVSHELRSPLTTLAASLDVLEAHVLELGTSGRAALTLLGADLRRFQRMVSELLEISRTDIGKAEVVLEVVEVGELVRRSVAAASRTIAQPPPELEMRPEIAGRRISVDKRRFERIVGNLLENAAHYGGGATLILGEPGPEPDRPTVRISVDDQGPGIAPGERERVFERFYRGVASGRRGAGTGTGLGLSLVAEHVRLLGGSVCAGEAPGGGARFTVELPADVHDLFDDEEDEEESTAEQSASAGEPSAPEGTASAPGAPGSAAGGEGELAEPEDHPEGVGPLPTYQPPRESRR